MSSIFITISSAQRAQRVVPYALLALAFAFSSTPLPMLGVPVTLQTLVLLGIGFTAAVAGGSLAALATVGVGIAVGVASGTIPLARVIFTGGYLTGMVLAAPLVTWLAEPVLRKTTATWRVAVRLTLAGTAGLALVLACGWAWLAFGMLGWGAVRAWAVGVAPFVPLEGVKLALAVTGAMALQRLLTRR